MPNLSSNVIASSLAIRFGCKAINLMVCNGETSGIDALYLAANAIRTRRATRILVVGVEPSNEVVKKIMEASASDWPPPGTLPRIGDGSAAVVLEDAESAAERSAVVYAEMGSYSYHPSNHLSQTILGANGGSDGLPELWLTPSSSPGPSAEAVGLGLELWKDIPPTCLDLTGVLGETYGALGVFQCIGACLWLRRHASAKAIATSGACWGEGTASIIMRGAEHSWLKPFFQESK
jgi:3-oxoacyl-[acyl-carrier-protein] synthase II